MINLADRKLPVFVDFAKGLASLSKCKTSRKVGCIILTPDFTQVLSIGYNGQPAGIERCQPELDICGCIHAEANAIAKLTTERSGLIMIQTLSPCKLCAGLTINTKRISTVLYLEKWKDTTGLDLLKEVGIDVHQI